MPQHIYEKDADPDIPPEAIGHHWVNTGSKNTWLSMEVGYISGWKKLMIDGAAFSNFRIKNGELQLANITTGEFHTIMIVGTSGQESIAWGPGEP